MCAIDPDEGLNEGITYSLKPFKPNSDATPLFEIQAESGDVKAIREPTDADLGRTEWVLVASDNAPNGQQRSTMRIIAFNISGPRHLPFHPPYPARPGQPKEEMDPFLGLFGSAELFYSLTAFTVGAFACILVILILIVLLRYRTASTPPDNPPPPPGYSP